MTLDPTSLAITIFVLRVVHSGISTVRLILMNRQRRLLVTIMAFFESLIFAVTIASVVTDMSNWQVLIAYCGGFAVGNYVGMWLESRFITSFMTVHVIASDKGHEIALSLREAGFGVTETIGEGHKGRVVILRSVLQHRDVPRLTEVVRQTHTDAFISIEEARAVQRGWIRAARGQS